MTGHVLLIRVARLAVLSLALGTPSFRLVGSEATVVKTNWSTRWITNVIEVSMPVNRFVNQYHTNWITQFRTNWNMRTVTNTVVVEALWTNTLVAHQTNHIMKMRTNFVAVNLVRTNFVTRYQTNWSVLNLTNWETVVLFKTNRITHAVTNTVQVDAPGTAPAALAAAPQPLVSPEARVEALSTISAVGWNGPLAIEATRTARPPANNLVELRMNVRRTAATAAPLQVQQWRVEREDATILLFGQDQEFKRQLPAGKYKVEVRLKADGDNPPLVARGTLAVTLQDVAIQPRLLVKK